MFCNEETTFYNECTHLRTTITHTLDCFCENYEPHTLDTCQNPRKDRRNCLQILQHIVWDYRPCHTCFRSSGNRYQSESQDERARNDQLRRYYRSFCGREPEDSVGFFSHDEREQFLDARVTNLRNTWLSDWESARQRLDDTGEPLSQVFTLDTLAPDSVFLRKCKAEEELDPCAICREGMVKGQDLRKIPCGHKWHFECIRRVFEGEPGEPKVNSCPMCRQNFDLNK